MASAQKSPSYKFPWNLEDKVIGNVVHDKSTSWSYLKVIGWWTGCKHCSLKTTPLRKTLKGIWKDKLDMSPALVSRLHQ